MKYLLFSFAAIALILSFVSVSNIKAQSIPPAPTAPAAADNKVPCDPNIAKNIVENGPPRFKIIKDCVTVTGTVVGVKPHKAPDGDMVFALKLDKEFSSMTTVVNNQIKMKGGIWVEEICQGKNKSTESHHEGDCSFPQFIKHFANVKLGNRLQITGTFLQDVREGGHTEIHPVSDAKLISK